MIKITDSSISIDIPGLSLDLDITIDNVASLNFDLDEFEDQDLDVNELSLIEEELDEDEKLSDKLESEFKVSFTPDPPDKLQESLRVAFQ
jgi:hypothetical protein